PQNHFWLTKQSVFGSYPYIACHHQLASATQRGSIDCGDHRAMKMQNGLLNDLNAARIALGRNVIQRLEMLDIATSHEKLASTCDDDGAQSGRQSRQAIEFLRQLFGDI